MGCANNKPKIADKYATEPDPNLPTSAIPNKTEVTSNNKDKMYTDIADFKATGEKKVVEYTEDESNKGNEGEKNEDNAPNLLKGYADELKNKGKKKQIMQNKNIIKNNSQELAGSLIGARKEEDVEEFE